MVEDSNRAKSADLPTGFDSGIVSEESADDSTDVFDVERSVSGGYDAAGVFDVDAGRSRESPVGFRPKLVQLVSAGAFDKFIAIIIAGNCALMITGVQL